MAVEKTPNVPPFVSYCAQLIPTVFDNSLSYYEALAALAKWLQDNVVNVINNNATITEEYIQMTKDMKEYMDNYFDNLDVQEEINNKLDDMVEQGTLQEIITSYIQANVAWTFDTVADMKLSENLISGSYAQTLGFHSINDGGGALYFINNTGTVDEIATIAVGTLKAHLVYTPVMSVNQFGVIGDGETDQSSKLTTVISLLPHTVKELVFDTEDKIFTQNTIDISEKEGLKLTFKVKIHRESDEVTGFGFRLTKCKNLQFDNLELYSERNQIEPAPADHTRVSQYGSNIVGVIMYACSYITFNNPKFEYTASDFFNQPSANNESSDHIFINGWHSRNASIPLFMQYAKNIYIDKANLIPAIDMGHGDHFLYFSNYVENVFVTDSYFENTDTNYGGSINFYNTGVNASDASCPKNLFVDNCIFKACYFVISERYSSNVKMSNCIFTMNTTYSVFYCEHTSVLDIENCTVNGSYSKLIDNSNSATITIKGCDISNSSATPDVLIIVSGTYSPTIRLIGNTINCNKVLVYSANTVSLDLLVKDNNIIQAAADNYLFSIRKADAKVRILGNCISNSVNRDNFIYNGGTLTTDFVLYYNVIKGYRNVANATETEYIQSNYNLIEANS